MVNMRGAGKLTRKYFDMLKDDSGKISFTSLHKACSDCGVSVSEHDVRLMIDEADSQTQTRMVT